MLKEQRQKRIIELMKNNEGITSKEISEQLNISAPTIWRDLKSLSASGKISKTHGGGLLNKSKDFELLFSTRLKANTLQKNKIAKYASTLISDGDIIAIDTGTTATLLAATLKSRNNITVVTTSLGVVQELLDAKEVYTILLGGDVNEKIMATTGAITTEHIKTLNVDKYFMGAFAFDTKKGTQDAYLFEIPIKKALMSIAEKVILMIDSSKIAKKSLSTVAAINKIDTIITDNKITKKDEKEILKYKLKLKKI